MTKGCMSYANFIRLYYSVYVSVDMRRI